MRVAAEMLTEQRFAGHVPGRGADGAAHTRPGLCSHVRVPALIHGLERVGDGGGSGPGRRQACGCGIHLGALDMLGASMRLLIIWLLERM